MLKNILLKTRQHFESEEVNQIFLSVLYSAIFSTAYFGLLRIGEVATGSHPILVNDVHVGTNKNKILIILRTSKTHTEGCFPQSIKITSVSKNQKPINNEPSKHWLEELCPYKL